MNNTTSGDLLEKLRKAKRTGNYRDKTTTTLLGDLQMKKNDFQGISNNGIYQTVDGELLAKSILNEDKSKLNKDNRHESRHGMSAIMVEYHMLSLYAEIFTKDRPLHLQIQLYSKGRDVERDFNISFVKPEMKISTADGKIIFIPYVGQSAYLQDEQKISEQKDSKEKRRLIQKYDDREYTMSHIYRSYGFKDVKRENYTKETTKVDGKKTVNIRIFDPQIEIHNKNNTVTERLFEEESIEKIVNYFGNLNIHNETTIDLINKELNKLHTRYAEKHLDVTNPIPKSIAECRERINDKSAQTPNWEHIDGRMNQSILTKGFSDAHKEALKQTLFCSNNLPLATTSLTVSGRKQTPCGTPLLAGGRVTIAGNDAQIQVACR